MKKLNYNQCGKYFAKGFKLKVHIQNVHEIEKIRYESINDIMEMIITFKNFQKLTKFKCKICIKEIIDCGIIFLCNFWQSLYPNQYKCPTCDKSYTESHNLKKHRQKEHGL